MTESAGSAARDRPALLWVKSAVPWPLDQGNHFIAYNLLKHLSPRFDITFVVPVRDDSERERARILSEFCRVVTVLRPNTRSVVHRGLWRAWYLARRVVKDVTSEVHYETFGALREALRREASTGRYDAAFLHYWYLHPLIGSLCGLPSAVLLHDNEPQRIESEMAAHPDRRPALERKLRLAVAGHHALMQKASRVLFYSAPDLEDWTARAGVAPENGVVFPYLYNFAPRRLRAEVEDRLLFTGHMSYGPNVDAAVWFAREIFPLVRRERPTATFRIAGKRPAPEVAGLAEIDGVEVTGYVDDMQEELVSGAVYVAPLRYGGGLKIKLIEAGGQACAIVATDSALRGLGLAEGSEVVRADDPGAFARETLRLLGDPAARRSLGEAARASLVARFGVESTVARVAALLEDVIAEGRRSPASGTVLP